MPMRSAVVAMVVNIVLNLTLIWFMGTAGLALSTAICSYLQVIILLIVLRRRLGKTVLQGIIPTTAKTIAATLLMAAAGAVILALCRNLPAGTRFSVLKLALIVPVSAVVYFFAAKFLNIDSLSLLTGKKPVDG